MDAFKKAWDAATWTERLTLGFWSLLAAALFAVGTVVSANVQPLAASLTGLVFGGFVFVAMAPKVSGSEERRRRDG